MSHTIWLKRLERETRGGHTETLKFTAGVNVLVGPPNSGKSMWLSMLDFCLGDTDSVQIALGDVLSEKYGRAAATFAMGSQELVLERRWAEHGLKTKVLVNGEPVAADSFSELLLDRLEVPYLHYPQGNPYSGRTWPELSWRSMLRHAYRRQMYWSDLADRQPESEQHACLLNFLGLAEVLYSSDYGKLVEFEVELRRLRSRRDAFESLLDELAGELVNEKEVTVAVTGDSLAEARRRLEDEGESLIDRRERLLTDLIDEADGGAGDGEFDELTAALGNFEAMLGDAQTRLENLEARSRDIQAYREAVAAEIGRLTRTSDASLVLADLRVTNCPACDQAVVPGGADAAHCYVCTQPLASGQAEDSGTGRLELELERLTAEVGEAEELLQEMRRQRSQLAARCRELEEHVTAHRSALRPLQGRVARALPRDLSLIDVRFGQVQERLSQLARTERVFQQRAGLVEEMRSLERDIAALQEIVDAKVGQISYDEGADLLATGFNNYLNALNSYRPNSWTQKQVDATINDRGFSFSVGRRPWTKQLGGTLRLYFLLAYHYTLLAIPQEVGHYPGLAILDFPPELDDGRSIRDQENFVLEPFVDLLERQGIRGKQLIAAGNAFEDLDGAHRIELVNVWT